MQLQDSKSHFQFQLQDGSLMSLKLNQDQIGGGLRKLDFEEIHFLKFVMDKFEQNKILQLYIQSIFVFSILLQCFLFLKWVRLEKRPLFFLM